MTSSGVPYNGCYGSPVYLAWSFHGMGRAARCLLWQVLFRAAFPRTTLAPFSARGSPVTYAVA